MKEKVWEAVRYTETSGINNTVMRNHIRKDGDLKIAMPTVGIHSILGDLF
jgi:hypothetical protein